MQISISTIKDQQGMSLPFKFTIAPSDFDTLGEEVSLPEPVHVQGTVTNTGSSMLLRARASALVELQCSRCLQDVRTPVEAVVEERFRAEEAEAATFEDEELADDDDVGYYERDRIEVGEVVRENFVLQIPMKPVCDDACQGLCPQCGINFNVDSCSCTRDDTDPRLAVLREWQERHGSST